jgi:hypothetical protein
MKENLYYIHAKFIFLEMGVDVMENDASYSMTQNKCG